jgi:hypothetical protein
LDRGKRGSLVDDDKQNTSKGQSCFENGHPRITIEIRPKIIYVDTVRFVFLAPDIP